jgi:maleamate amidohydrolase
MRLPVHKRMTFPIGATALLMVDIQEEQRSDPNYYAHGFDQILSNTSRLLNAARLNGFQIAHAQYIRDFSMLPPRPFEASLPDGSPTFSDSQAGQIAICAEVAPTADEVVFTKNDASAFLGTGLNQWLTDYNTKWLVICGVWTEACIAATVRDAIARGYRALLVKDACGSGSKAMHETAVLNLANRLYGGGICDTDRAVSMLNGRKAEIWQVSDPVPIRFTNDTITNLYDQL